MVPERGAQISHGRLSSARRAQWRDPVHNRKLKNN
jgi:hypothetical protein